MFEKLIMLLVFIGPIFGWLFRKYREQKLKKELESYKSNLRIKESKDALFNKKIKRYRVDKREYEDPFSMKIYL